jgi:DNA-binding GntR family transcriptional regulator
LRSGSIYYHRQIVEAVEKGDAEGAETVMREHVYEGRDFVIRALDGDKNG